MAPVTEQEGPSRGDHRGHGQREQDDAVKEHRGDSWVAVRPRLNVFVLFSGLQ